jgi:hypothetical protein
MNRKIPLEVRKAIALLRIHTAWRDRVLDRLIAYEPEPAKVTAALALVIPYLLANINITLE